MSVIRIQRHEKPYVVLDKQFLHDKSISCSLKGFLAFCLSQPDDWIFRVSHLSSVLKEKRDAIFSMIKEGIQNGYILRENQKRDDKGKFTRCDYAVFETKQQVPDEIKIISPQPAFPYTAKSTLPRNEAKLRNNIYKKPPPPTPPIPENLEKSPGIPNGGGGLSNSLELVKFKSKSGKDLQITISELKKHLEEFPADVIEKAVEEIDSNKPITNILKYTKSICKRLYSEGRYVSVSETPVKKCLSREEREERWRRLGIKPPKEPTKEDRQAQREADERRKKVLERANMKAWQIKKLEREEAEKKRPSPLGQTEANDTVGGEYR
jgi:hypothetical protein